MFLFHHSHIDIAIPWIDLLYVSPHLCNLNGIKPNFSAFLAFPWFGQYCDIKLKRKNVTWDWLIINCFCVRKIKYKYKDRTLIKERAQHRETECYNECIIRSTGLAYWDPIQIVHEIAQDNIMKFKSLIHCSIFLGNLICALN